MTTLTSRVTLRQLASPLATRAAGDVAFRNLSMLLRDAPSVEVDFEEHELAPSFADQCFGQLVAAIGFEMFRERVKLVRVPEQTKSLLRHIIVRRASSTL